MKMGSWGASGAALSGTDILLRETARRRLVISLRIASGLCVRSLWGRGVGEGVDESEGSTIDMILELKVVGIELAIHGLALYTVIPVILGEEKLEVCPGIFDAADFIILVDEVAGGDMLAVGSREKAISLMILTLDHGRCLDRLGLWGDRCLDGETSLGE
jgi:hypothetical protein